jgi:hypothetical protein
MHLLDWIITVALAFLIGLILWSVSNARIK